MTAIRENSIRNHNS